MLCGSAEVVARPSYKGCSGCAAVATCVGSCKVASAVDWCGAQCDAAALSARCSEGMQEMTMADAKTRVTVTSVRVANGKMMSAGKGGATPPPAPPTPRVASSLRDVATGGQRAMQALKKA